MTAISALLLILLSFVNFLISFNCLIRSCLCSELSDILLMVFSFGVLCLLLSILLFVIYSIIFTHTQHTSPIYMFLFRLSLRLYMSLSTCCTGSKDLILFCLGLLLFIFGLEQVPFNDSGRPYNGHNLFFEIIKHGQYVRACVCSDGPVSSFKTHFSTLIVRIHCLLLYYFYFIRM